LKNRTQFFFGLWCLLFAISSGLLFQLAANGLNFKSSLLDLLPETEQDIVVSNAVNKFTKRVSNQCFFLIGHADELVALSSAKSFEKKLLATNYFSSIKMEMSQDAEEQIFKTFFPYKDKLLSPDVIKVLKNKNAIESLCDNSIKTLYSPLGSVAGKLINEDPMLLFSSYWLSIPKSMGKMRYKDNVLWANDQNIKYVFISAITDEDSFSINSQGRVVHKINEIKQEIISGQKDLKILISGMIFFAHEGSVGAKREISTIGIGSLLGIILLMWLAFRSFRQIFLCLLSLAMGLLTGFTYTILIFGELHLLTLGFGASLIGVCIDYSFHFFAEKRLSSGEISNEKILNRILPGITLGVITSVIGYFSLIFTPFPGLQQMAVFSCFGITGAFLTVLMVYPILLKNKSNNDIPFLFNFTKIIIGFWQIERIANHKIFILLILVVVSLVGFLNISTNDDIRILNSSSKELKNIDKKIKSLIGDIDLSRFLLIEGKTAQDVLELEEQLQPILNELAKEKVFKYYHCLSRFIPSVKYQKENFLLLRKNLRSEKEIFKTKMLGIGLGEVNLTKYLKNIENSSQNYLGLKEGLSSPIGENISSLWLGKTERGFASMILLSNVAKENILIDLERKHNDVHYINKVKDLSDLLSRYRRHIFIFVLISYLAIFILLFFKYKFIQSLLVTLPPILACGLAFFIFFLVNIETNIFHILAILLVMGIGIDYTIFFAEAKEHRDKVGYAVFLSAITSLLSFGLLAFSNAVFLSSFGLTVLFGLVFTFLLSPMVGSKDAEDSIKDVFE